MGQISPPRGMEDREVVDGAVPAQGSSRVGVGPYTRPLHPRQLVLRAGA